MSTPSPRDPSCPFVKKARFTHSHNVSKWHTWSKGEQGQPREKWIMMLKSSFTVYEKEDFTLSLKIQLINVCIRGYNCCQTGIELSKCVYLLQIPVSNDFSCVGKPFKDKLKRKKLTWQHPKINFPTCCPRKWCHWNVYRRRRNFVCWFPISQVKLSSYLSKCSFHSQRC